MLQILLEHVPLFILSIYFGGFRYVPGTVLIAAEYNDDHFRKENKLYK